MHSTDGGVLLDIDQNLMFSVNVVGSTIWQKLEGGVSADQIAKEIAEEFGLPLDQARADVTSFIEDLRAHKLIAIGN